MPDKSLILADVRESKSRDDRVMLRSMRVREAVPLLCGLALLVPASADAAPKPPPKFWSTARCERVMLTQHPSVSQVLCVGSRKPARCRWTSGHRARLYSEFTVFTRLRQRYVPIANQVVPGVVRSFTLATRARHGFDAIRHHWGDQYIGWPADFFIAHARLLATRVTPARFRSIVAPIAARLMQEKTTGCAGA
jgi:hypothetical protein